MKKWEYRLFGQDDSTDFVVVDNRFDVQKPGVYSLGCTNTSIKLYLKDRPKETWDPLLVIPVGSRFNKAEAEEYAKKICDRLNVAAIEEVLKGA